MSTAGILRASPPHRLVVLGGSGFLGRRIGESSISAGWRTLLLGSRDLNLEDAQAVRALAGMLEPADTVVHAAAVTPVKTSVDFARNMVITRAVVKGMEAAGVEHLALVSSDGVYGSNSGCTDEMTEPLPDTLHGLMHLGREDLCLSAGFPIQVIVRPSAIYGANDPHNSYGPNRFVRSAVATARIVVFGKGESVRDHVSVDDVAAIVALAVSGRSSGVLNAVSGEAISFKALAEEIRSLGAGRWMVVQEGQELPPTFRTYDAYKLMNSFPEFETTKLLAGMQKLVADVKTSRRL